MCRNTYTRKHTHNTTKTVNVHGTCVYILSPLQAPLYCSVYAQLFFQILAFTSYREKTRLWQLSILCQPTFPSSPFKQMCNFQLACQSMFEFLLLTVSETCCVSTTSTWAKLKQEQAQDESTFSRELLSYFLGRCLVRHLAVWSRGECLHYTLVTARTQLNLVPFTTDRLTLRGAHGMALPFAAGTSKARDLMLLAFQHLYTV